MSAPKSKGVDKTGLYRWDDTEKIFVAWDGKLVSNSSESGEIGEQVEGFLVSDPNTNLLSEMLTQLKLINQSLACLNEGETMTEEDLIDL